MKIFQAVQKFYKLLGFPSKIDGSNVLNRKNAAILYILIQGFIVTAISGFKANTVRECGDLFFACMTELSGVVNLSIFIWGKYSLKLKFIEKLEGLIQKSE